jgi:hypothetical protein
MAIEDGLVYPAAASCGPLGNPARAFSRHVAGMTVVFLVPRSQSSGPELAEANAALDAPVDSSGKSPLDAHRMMAASCLAWRAGDYGLGFEYGRLAADPFDAETPELRYFLRCIGRSRSSDIRCAAAARHLGQCAFRAPISKSIRSDLRLGRI